MSVKILSDGTLNKNIIRKTQVTNGISVDKIQSIVSILFGYPLCGRRL